MDVIVYYKHTFKAGFFEANNFEEARQKAVARLKEQMPDVKFPTHVANVWGYYSPDNKIKQEVLTINNYEDFIDGMEEFKEYTEDEDF